MTPRSRAIGVVALVDADVLLPSDFRTLLDETPPKAGVLVGLRRRMARTPADFDAWRCGSIDLPAFWMRRVRRLVPPTFAMVVVVLSNGSVETEQIASVQAWRADRDEAAVTAALGELARVASDEQANIMPATIEAAHAGVTTGEWAATLREAFGEYRGPTGVSGAAGHPEATDDLAALRGEVDRVSEALGRRIKVLIGKPGLDGHSNGAEQIAVAARDAGMEVVYSGIRLTPAQIAASARDEDPDVIGLSILSGSHLQLVPDVLQQLRELGVDAPLILGGIIPEADRENLRAMGVAAIYTPKDFDIARIMREIATLADNRRRTNA
jgi:(2R)-ethylmalonyl-CoA mutase